MIWKCKQELFVMSFCNAFLDQQRHELKMNAISTCKSMYEDRDYILIPLGIIIIKSQDRPFSSRLSFCDCVTEVIVLWYSISYFIYIRGKLGFLCTDICSVSHSDKCRRVWWVKGSHRDWVSGLKIDDNRYRDHCTDRRCYVSNDVTFQCIGINQCVF